MSTHSGRKPKASQSSSREPRCIEGEPVGNVFPDDDVGCRSCFDGLDEEPEERPVEVSWMIKPLPCSGSGVGRARDCDEPSICPWQLVGRD